MAEMEALLRKAQEAQESFESQQRASEKARLDAISGAAEKMAMMEA